uniref:DNA-directed RNA polymerase III subunit RPC5 n=1 Tax=Eutreptiella gymnastica TaxID=73025 RepID=A0A7S4G0G6_9EUGL
MDEDDEIVGEFDVFISQQMPNQLYLLQYPLRPSWRPYDLEQLKTIRMKKPLHKMEMDFRINTKGENYNKEWKDKAEGKDDTFTLESTRMQPKTKYAIGVLNADGFHLTSLPYVLQMRPDMSACKVGGLRRVDDDAGEDKAQRQVQSKHVADMLARQQRRLFSFKKVEEAKEAWSMMGIHLSDSIEANSQLHHLYCNTTVRVKTGINPQRYVDAIFPPVKSDEASSDQRRWAKVPLSRIQDYPMDRRISSLLLSAHIMSFSQIKALVRPTKADDTDLIARLEQCAVLVQGNWVIKGLQNCRGQLAAIRELLLYNFHQSERVSKLKFTDSIPNCTTFKEDIAALFRDIAELDPYPDRPGGLWKLKCPTDDAFLATFPDVVAKQGALWETRINRIKTGLADGSNTLTFPWQPADPSLDGAGGAVAAPRDDAISQQKEVQKFIIEQFRKYGVCSPVMLRAEYRLKKSDTSHPLSLTSEDLYASLLEKMTRKFNDALVLLKMGVPEVDKWRQHMLQVFQEKKENKKEEVVGRIKELCGEEIPSGMFGRLVREIAIPSSNRQNWTAKAGLMGKTTADGT